MFGFVFNCVSCFNFVSLTCAVFKFIYSIIYFYSSFLFFGTTLASSLLDLFLRPFAGPKTHKKSRPTAWQLWPNLTTIFMPNEAGHGRPITAFAKAWAEVFLPMHGCHV